MNTFICRKLRLCTYLVDAGFTPLLESDGNGQIVSEENGQS